MFKLLIGLTFLGCSVEEDNKDKKKIPQHIHKLNNLTVYSTAENADTVHLEWVQTFDKYFFSFHTGNPPIVVDDLNRVYMYNQPKLAIDVYDSLGNFLIQLGRKGRGPGEFHQVHWMQIFGDNLYAYDGQIKQFQVFSLESLSYETTVHAIPTNLNIIPNISNMTHEPIYVMSDSVFLYRFENLGQIREAIIQRGFKAITSDINYYLMNQNRHLLPDTILNQKGVKRVYTDVNGISVSLILPFTRRSLIAVSQNARIYAAWNQDFLIKEYNMKGKYLRSFYYPYKRASLTQSQIDSITHGEDIIKRANQKTIDNTKIPATWPALHSMMADDQNRLWISTIVKNQNIYQWWVLNDQGKLLARFRWPRDQPIAAIKNGYLYTIKGNHNLETYMLEKFKIHFLY